MKIVHLCLSAFYIDNYSYQENMLLRYHAQMGHDVTVIASLYSFDKNGKPCYLESSSEYDDELGYHVRRLAYKRPVKINKVLRRYVGLMQALEAEKPDLVFSHNISFSDVSVLVRYLKKHPQTKLYADNHADYINSARSFLSKYILHGIIWKYYAQMLEPYLLTCFGVTPMRCRFLKDMYNLPENKIKFLPMGVDDEAIPANREEVRAAVRKELRIPKNDKVIFTGGKIDKLKNTHVLLEAFSRMNDPHTHLVICGVLAPEMKYLCKQIEECPNIVFLGWCNSKRVMEMMVASDIACFPGTHSTLWEQSVGVGLPAIFKLWDEMTHVDVNGNCTFVHGEDADELLKKMRHMLTEENLKNYIQCAKAASEIFLYSKIARMAIVQEK